MRKQIIQLFFLFLSGFFNNLFCQKIPVLNLAQAIEHPENITLSDFVESITYIPLATSFDYLVDKYPRVYVTKEYIITITAYKCLVFNRKNGEFLREIGKYGRGPGEYQSSLGLLNECIPAYFFTGFNGTLVKYTLDGVFRGNIKIPGYKDSFVSPSYPMNYSFINDSVIVCDLLIALGTEPNSLMIFNEKGKVYKIIPNRNILKTKQNFTLRTDEMRFYHFDNRLLAQSMYNDTVFQVSVDKLIPYFVLNRGKHCPPFESKWWSLEKQLQAKFINQPRYSESNRFITFNFIFNKNTYFALYDKSSKLLKVSDNNSGLNNDIDGFMNIIFDHMNSEGEIIGLIQAKELVYWIEKNPEKVKTLNPRLQKLQNIKIEDNPVIVIANYKK
jgi:hypothetical protein